jgi:hypothetical protein
MTIQESRQVSIDVLPTFTDKQRTVVDLPAADLPGFCNPERILLDAFGLRRWYNQHRDLAALSRFQALQCWR